MNRIAVRLTSTMIMSGIGGILASPVLPGMIMFFFISVMAYGVLDAVTFYFGDHWT
jgi:hypothetical protein